MTFLELHHRDGPPLLLPNAWDVPSALAFAEAGFPAVGTTSFGVAASAGTPDGARTSKDATLALVRQLAPLPVHVSADIEDGYDDTPERVAAYVASLGADGINIEDSSAERLIDPRRHAAKIAAIKQRTPDVFVNARVDTYWLRQDARRAASLERARVYVEAGADGVFVPGASDPADLRAFADALPVPLNVLVVPGVSLAELGELGVRRVSTGSLPYRRAVDAAVEVAACVRDGRPVPTATPYPVMQERLVRYRDSRGK
ncbi:isocitrate lyase/PEP mutase family protein [Streptomyces sp. NBC_01497]|uniref:isocitrate lyase/PEP mutase family protein n=1 Tax=Streptomyces sp. NBC_01497 TaxID=2903885 RepID=UPI002E36C0D7|nr:isocitrate lyase/phosphoenolpyruvate mutase family protein [Streptomyces sp. NBC_01497]